MNLEKCFDEKIALHILRNGTQLRVSGPIGCVIDGETTTVHIAQYAGSHVLIEHNDSQLKWVAAEWLMEAIHSYIQREAA